MNRAVQGVHLRRRTFLPAVLVYGAITLTSGRTGAQTLPAAEPSSPPAQAAPTPDPSSYEARAAVARTVRVITAILDVAPGMHVDEAREKLDKLADPKTPPKQEGGDAPEEKDERDGDAPGKKDKEPGVAPKKALEKDEDEGGTKILWKLAPGSPYEWVFIEADKDEKITAVFGYCWPDKPIPFEQIGDVGKAPIHDANQAAWDSLQPKRHYLIVANGAKEAASQVSVSLVSTRTNGIRMPIGK